MTNCSNFKYTPEEYYGLIEHIRKGDYYDYITERFDPNTANALLKGISQDQDFRILKDFPEIYEFLESLTSEDQSEIELKESSIPDYDVNDEQVSLTPYAETVELGEGVRADYEEYVNEFKTQVIENCLLKDGQLINPDDVSLNLFNYRIKLLNRILDYISPGATTPEFNDSIEFTKFVRKTLSNFSRAVNESKKLGKNDYQQYFSAFIQLKYFDHFLSDEISFISIKPEYVSSNLLGKDMYVSTGPFNYKDRLSNYSEEAGVEDYTSSFVKSLL